MFRKHARALTMGMVLVLLSSCAAWHPPKPQMPTRDSVVPGKQVTVHGNQNIYAVAMYYKVPMRELIVLNNLQPPYRLKSGQKITLPSTAEITADYVNPDIGTSMVSSAGGATSTVSTSLAPGAVEAVSLDPIPVTKTQPAPATPVATTVKLQPAQQTNTVSPVEALNAPKPEAKPLVTTKTTKAAPKEQVPATEQAVGEADDVGDAPDFRWPVDGPITSSFGAKGNGRSNDGVNIAAPKGAPVVAAAGGTVVYAGNEMKGFGNLILIRHSGDWVTAYAHLDRMLVTKDSIVAKGDMIGMVGKTGSAASPQLHFEIRHDSKPVNPKDYVE